MLGIPEIKKILEEPVSRSAIRQAIEQEERIRFHTKTDLTRPMHSGASGFLNWVKGLLPADKYNLFLHLFRFPVQSIALTDDIFTALGKVYEGKNPVRSFDFTNPETEEDFQEYSKGDFKVKSFKALKEQINAVMVVDLPSEQSAERPEPYWYLLDISNVVDYKLTDEGEFEWIFFTPKKDRLAVFDGDSYQLFEVEEGTYEIKSVISEASHDLGYTPAKFFWTDEVYQGVKKSPVSNELANLDWYLFHAIGKRNLDSYAGFPIYWGYEPDCDYEHPENGSYCKGGFVRTQDGNYLINRQSGSLMQCPVCSNKKLNGAGSFIEIPVPDDEVKDISPPLGIISIDKDSLEYNVEEQKRLRLEIYQSVTGFGGELQNDQAVNEKQVAASFESRNAVLNILKRNLEIAETWLCETVAKLRYGASFQGCSISYGTEFYMFSADELLDKYKQARDAKIDDAILDDLLREYHETKYKNNPEKLHRANILSHLDPFTHLTKTEVRELFTAGIIDYPEYFLKQNFSTLIRKFERENISITTFGEMLDFPKKIERIKETLLSYAKQPINQNKGEGQQQVPSTEG